MIGLLDRVRPNPDLRMKLDELATASDLAVQAEARQQLALAALADALLANDRGALQERLVHIRADAHVDPPVGTVGLVLSVGHVHGQHVASFRRDVLQGDRHRRPTVVARDVDHELAPGGEVRHCAGRAHDMRWLGVPRAQAGAVVVHAEQQGAAATVREAGVRPREVGSVRFARLELDPLVLAAADQRAQVLLGHGSPSACGGAEPSLFGPRRALPPERFS